MGVILEKLRLIDLFVADGIPIAEVLRRTAEYKIRKANARACCALAVC